MSMSLDQALAAIDELLLGEKSILVQLRVGAGLDRARYARLVGTIRFLIEYYRENASVPKKLALAFVDISNYFYFKEDMYPSDVLCELEDAAHQLTAMASELFET
jgi:hypothetical protein